MVDFLNSLVDQYGYFGVFVLAFFDHTGIPGGLLIGIGAVTAGYMNIYAVFLLSFLGGLMGDIAFYALGFYGGKRILQRLERNRESFVEKMEKAAVFFKEHGNKSVLWGRFPALIGKYIMACAGVFSFSFYKFLWFSMIGGLLMILVYGLPYYFLGSELIRLFESKILIMYLTLGVFVVLLIIGVVRGFLKRI